jgi:hypothetical protein
MKKSIFYLFFCLVSSTTMAAEFDSSVVFRASFLKNELQSYEISRSLYTMKKSDTTSLERLRFKADVYVMDSTENYYLLTWKFSKFAINTEDIQLRQLIALAKSVEISYRISKPGVLNEFLNGKDVSTCLEEALSKVLASYANKKGTESQAEVEKLYEMRETVETMMLRSVNQFHQAYGLGYKLGEVIDDSTELDSRFSSKPIQGIIRKKLTKIDSENHFAILSTATFYNEKQFQKAFMEYMKIDSIPENAVNQENMGGVVMDMLTGWVLWTFEQRETRFGNNVYGELVEIQHIDDL